jgi:predicted benzoate:H+ symporter BenE
MSGSNYSYDEAFGFGMTAIEIQSVARRQLAASVAVAIVIVLGIVFAALTPAAHDRAEVAVHKFAQVQQPIFVKPADRLAAAKHYGIELP